MFTGARRVKSLDLLRTPPRETLEKEAEVPPRPRTVPLPGVRFSGPIDLRQLTEPESLTTRAPTVEPQYSLQRSVAEAQRYRERQRRKSRAAREADPADPRIKDWLKEVPESGTEQDVTKHPIDQERIEADESEMTSSRSSGSPPKRVELKIGISPPEVVKKDQVFPYPVVVRVRSQEPLFGYRVMVYLTTEDKVNLPAGKLSGTTSYQCQSLEPSSTKYLKDSTQAVAIMQDLRVCEPGDYRLNLDLYDSSYTVVDKILTKRFRVTTDPFAAIGHPSSSERQLFTLLQEWKSIIQGPTGLWQTVVG